MKSKISSITKIFLVMICIILITLIISSCDFETLRKDEYLLDTQWGQTNMYAKFCPENYRAGCWSTAIAQILYYHRITPTGKINYETTLGYKISEDLDSFEFNWDLFVDQIDDRTYEESIEQVAKYIYYTSIVLEKDFNTGYYKTIKKEYKDGILNLNVNNTINNLDNHFNCEFTDYHYTKEEIETNKDEIEKLIKEEIDSNRPIMLYIHGYSGHATVIDGYSYTDDKFIVHINQGNNDWGNKWYDFNKPIIDDLDDMNHRILITIKPLINNTKYAKKTLHKTNYLIKTKWDKEGKYSKFCPENEIIGDWSTALAQILAYHKYQPKGEINYETSSGLILSEKLDSYEFNWDLFEERLDAKATVQSIDQVAKYCYYTSLVLERNFGSIGYNTIIEDDLNIDISKAISNLNKYFNCDVQVYRYSDEEIKLSKDAIITLIKTEIDNKHPIMYFYKSYSANSYSAVIDGYLEENNEFFVHINTGMDGFCNQWYNLFTIVDDMKHWIFIAVK